MVIRLGKTAFRYLISIIVKEMKVNIFLCLIGVILFIIGCSSSRNSEDSLACIDINKNYPEKEINIADIADIVYVHLDTKNEDYLYKGGIDYISENNIVICDNYSGSILFFSTNGKPKSRFNRYGVGPKEYSSTRSIIIYDEYEDDLFINCYGKILVYSSTGEYKRTLTSPQGISVDRIVDFDDLSLLAYDSKRVYEKMNKPSDIKHISSHYKDSSFFCVSKKDGKVLDYVILPNNEIDLSFILRNGLLRAVPIYNRVVRCAEGVLLCNHEADTIFLYNKDKSLIPIIYKTPSARDLDPVVILDNFINTSKYQFMQTLTLSDYNGINGKFPPKYYIRDTKTGEIFIQKVILSDYKEKKMYISAENTLFNGKETLFHFELNLIELKQAYYENKLSGKLKELVATLNEEEDNNVFMFVYFK